MASTTPPSTASAAADHALARFGLLHKTAIVTGGTKGIGKACVEELARLGASVFTCARTQADVDAALADWKAAGLAVGGCAADCSSPAGRANLLAAAATWRRTQVGRGAGDPGLDVLVLNVGTNRAAPTTSYTDADLEFILDTNFESAFCLARDAHPALKLAGTRGWDAAENDDGASLPAPRASVVLMSSVAGGPTSMKSGSIYAATKAALDQLARNLAVEWAGDGIRVNAVKPSYTDTPLASRVLADPAGRASVLAVTPSRRIADPADVAGVVAWLAGPSAVHVSGTAIAVDGGYSVRGFW